MLFSAISVYRRLATQFSQVKVLLYINTSAFNTGQGFKRTKSESEFLNSSLLNVNIYS